MVRVARAEFRTPQHEYRRTKQHIMKTPKRVQLIKGSRPPMQRTFSDAGAHTHIRNLQQQVLDLQLTIEGLEKERDFYFGKLRDIEVVLQEDIDSNELSQDILRILYATEEGFAVPDDDDDDSGGSNGF